MNCTRCAAILAFVAAFSLSNSLAKSAEQFDDPLLTTPATPEVIAKGLEVDGYQLGVSAYSWGYPLVRMERVARSYSDVSGGVSATSYRAPLNKIGWAQELATPSAKDMPTANNDTYYMSAVVDLDQPYILSVPDTGDRYYVINVFNMWQELEHYIGRRTTGTKAGRYVIVPPGWTGEVPSDAPRLDVSTDKVWLWGRLRVAQGEAVEPVHALQKQFTLAPASGEAKSAELPPLPSIAGDELGFFKHLGFALRSNTAKPADQALFAQFARMGLTADGFDETKLSPQMRKGLVRALADAPSMVVSSFDSTSEVRNGWIWVKGLDSFGFNYPMRALVAGAYLGGNGEKEAMYPIRYTDAEGKVLNGANKYVIKMDEQPPVDAFWSLTMYNASDKMLVENPIQRYKVGTDTQGLKKAADGSLTIAVQNEKPDDADVNWLPAAKGDFYVILRMYQPSDAVLDGTYQMPQMTRVK
ncbi:DUF1254 domain-containing protein [Phyllobacterium endophyticum]|uniref:DUF1254 domain-containing protein n=1 Tax=Phyllobacterium endophyticum TaxID=1149773 RepID=UPI0011C7F548|nr:DUF1254 domain-containing protein [Phyllobacterium endophyticum]TXR46877.1 DUF1254 domain-containing protein [Phyllobacterium endophyticum]